MPADKSILKSIIFNKNDILFVTFIFLTEPQRPLHLLLNVDRKSSSASAEPEVIIKSEGRNQRISDITDTDDKI